MEAEYLSRAQSPAPRTERCSAGGDRRGCAGEDQVVCGGGGGSIGTSRCGSGSGTDGGAGDGVGIGSGSAGIVGVSGTIGVGGSTGCGTSSAGTGRASFRIMQRPL